VALRSRPMQPKDVPECAEMVATHPVVGPRYGRAIRDLRPAWSRLLDFDAKSATVFEKVESGRATIYGLGVSVFVSDDFVRELKTPPLFWFGPELARRMSRGNSPLLSYKQLQEANSSSGVNMVVWEGMIRPEYANDSDLHRSIMNVFIEDHRGFFWKEVIGSQVESGERLQWTITTGGLLWDPANAQYMDSLKRDPREIVKKPHLIGVTRDAEVKRAALWAGSWVGALFEYNPPQFAFSRSEQRLLEAAIAGESAADQDLADALGVSLPTIKKLWLSVYRRVADRRPEMICDRIRPQSEASGRGKEKKRRILAYLREHPEELRPVSPRLLGLRPGVGQVYSTRATRTETKRRA
jgi:hypothetical protein